MSKSCTGHAAKPVLRGRSQWAPWLCVPALRLVCLFRETLPEFPQRKRCSTKTIPRSFFQADQTMRFLPIEHDRQLRPRPRAEDLQRWLGSATSCRTRALRRRSLRRAYCSSLGPGARKHDRSVQSRQSFVLDGCYEHESVRHEDRSLGIFHIYAPRGAGSPETHTSWMTAGSRQRRIAARGGRAAAH